MVAFRTVAMPDIFVAWKLDSNKHCDQIILFLEIHLLMTIQNTRNNNNNSNKFLSMFMLPICTLEFTYSI